MKKEFFLKKENNFIQWKGTNICMDFYCECGTHNHYDGFLGYFVQCKNCSQIYKLDTTIMMEKVDTSTCFPLQSTI